MTADLVAGLVAGLAVAMPVGAIGTYLVGLAARERFPTAAAAALGVATTDGVYAVAAGLGGAGLRAAVGVAVPYLRYVAAAVLVVLAARTLSLAVRRLRAHRAAQTAPTGRRVGPLRAYLGLIVLTAVNPATIITFSAVVLGRRAASGSWWVASGLFAAGAFVASAAWQLLLAGGGSLLGKVLTGSRGQFGIAAASALIMLGLAGAVWLS